MICRQRLHENQLPLNNILPTNKIEGEVSLRKLRPPYFYNLIVHWNYPKGFSPWSPSLPPEGLELSPPPLLLPSV